MDLQGLISGFAGGFGQARQRSEDLNRLAQERQSEREAKVYTALLDSPDPEIQSLAATGLLHSSLAPNPKSGIRGWLGEMDQSPIMPRMLQLMQTPQTVPEVKQTLPSTQMTGMITTPPGEAPAALSATSPTEVGAPPPRPVESAVNVKEVPSVPYQTGVTRQVPRQLFLSPAQKAKQLVAAQYSGRAQGLMDAITESGGTVTPELAQQIALELSGYSGGGASSYQAVTGDMPDGSVVSGKFNRQTGRYEDPNTGEPLIGFRLRSGAGTSGIDRYMGTVEGSTLPAGTIDAYGRPVERGQFYRRMGDKLLPTVSPISYGAQANRAAADLGNISASEAVAAGQGPAVNTRDIALSRARSYEQRLGTGQGAFESPLTIPQGQATGLPPGTTGPQVQGQVVPTQQQRTRIINAQNIRNELLKIRGDEVTGQPGMLGVLPKAGTMAGLVPGAVMSVRGAMPQYRGDVAAVQSAINNIRAGLTRTIQANVGTETERDAQRALTTLADVEGHLFNPTAGDTQESAKRRIDETLAYLDQVISTLPSAAPTPVGAAPPAPAGAQPRQRLDTTVPGLFVDDQGNLIRR